MPYKKNIFFILKLFKIYLFSWNLIRNKKKCIIAEYTEAKRV